jgi:hypothetical protein
MKKLAPSDATGKTLMEQYNDGETKGKANFGKVFLLIVKHAEPGSRPLTSISNQCYIPASLICQYRIIKQFHNQAKDRVKNCN